MAIKKIRTVNGDESIDYSACENKPQIGGVELVGNKTLEELGIQPKGNYLEDSDISEWAKQPNKPTYTAGDVGALPDSTDIPQNTSDLTNDSGFITNSVNNLLNYYLKSETYTKEEVQNLLSTFTSLKIKVVASIDDVTEKKIIYFVPKDEKENDTYDEYILVNGKPEKIGNTKVDLSDYYTKGQIDAKGFVTQAEIDNAVAGKLDKNQGADNSGKVLGIGEDGNVKPVNNVTPEQIQDIQDSISDIQLYMSLDKNIELTDYRILSEMVKNGKAQELLKVGDQITVPWIDRSSNKEYQAIMDIVHFGDVELEDGSTTPGMFLQWHYATPYTMPFDNYEAFYHCEENLDAGTYYITMGDSWGNNVVEGKSYYFTLTREVPAGGQLAGFREMSGKQPSDWKVYSYQTKESTSALETVTVAEGTQGTYLGTMYSDTKYKENGINNMQRIGYGYNRWTQSGMRQWLNSKELAGKWWTPQNVFDRAPDQLTSKPGFLSGFDEKFLDIIAKIKVVTNLNTVSDGEIGIQEASYDKIFLPSLEQIYMQPQLAGEGEYWKYWKEVTGADTPQAQYGTYPERITYAIEDKTSPQSVRLRSASRGTANSTWGVLSSGYVYTGSAISALRCAPACVIC